MREKQYKRFLISIIVSAEYFILFSYSKSCEGLFCNQLNSTQSNLSSYINQPMRSATPESPGTHVNKIAFKGTIEGNKLNKKCCYNGGTCFLGTLCICPKKYRERYCEYEKWPQARSCCHELCGVNIAS
ncbi:uncharacterized protein LOC143794004 isoform X2 [Ranitomeya variabilis]|uniref:uncharacterized protein LOC143794004 isoform X2 n=1 Tax=Ranitomeya variabilis TaxID=490064 RepID=UPI0040568DCD